MTNFLEIFLEKIPSLEKRVNLLEEENTKLREENDLLRERLNLNSKNSSKPPSSDQKGSSQPPRKGGAKPSHKGHCRTMFPPEQIDKFVTVKTEICPTCGNTVIPVNEPPTIHQQIEMVLKPFIVTQYNRESFYCPCCRKHGTAPMPAEIGLFAFGTRLSALMGFLTGTCCLTRRLALKVLKEGLGIQAAVGSQSNVEKRLSFALKPVYQEIQDHIQSNRETRHVDETGWRCWGKREFVWLMSTGSSAIYKIQDGRNAAFRDAFLRKASLKRDPFVTDRLAIYRFHSPHQYCLAHIKRNIKKFAERSGLDKEWAQVMLSYLDKIFTLWRDYRERRRTKRSFCRMSRQYRDDFEYGLLVPASKQKQVDH